MTVDALASYPVQEPRGPRAHDEGEPQQERRQHLQAPEGGVSLHQRPPNMRGRPPALRELEGGRGLLGFPLPSGHKEA